MVAAVIDQGEFSCRAPKIAAVQCGARNAAADTTRIFHGNQITRRSIPVGELKAGPGAGNAGVDLKYLTAHLDAENPFRARAVHPARRARVPGPTASAGVRRHRV